MEILHFTIFFSVLLAACFIFLLCVANWKGWFSKIEQDSLIPLAKDVELSKPKPPEGEASQKAQELHHLKDVKSSSEKNDLS